MITTELCKIMTEEGSDKSGNWHNYTIEYYSLFNNKKDKNKNTFFILAKLRLINI